MGDARLTLALARLAEADRVIDVMETVRRAARRVASADGATVVLREGDKCFYADEDAMSPLWKGQRFPINECISGWAMLNEEVAVVGEISADDRIPLDAYRPTFVRSLAMVPVGRGPALGAIGTYWAHHHVAGADQLAALELLASATADALVAIGRSDAHAVGS